MLLALFCQPLSVLAHTGQAGHGFAAGFMHPFLGIDHLLAMLLVGMWSVLHSRHLWLPPSLFVSLLAAGVLFGQQGLSGAGLESLVAASVIGLGLLLATRSTPRPSIVLILIGGFAFCHGLAHGSELSAGSSVLAGILCGSALLHGTGMLLARHILQQRRALVTGLGQATALLGSGLLLHSLL